MHSLISQFLNDIHQTTWLEFIAVATGIASVIYSRKENILVYPVGMVSTGGFSNPCCNGVYYLEK